MKGQSRYMQNYIETLGFQHLPDPLQDVSIKIRAEKIEMLALKSWMPC